MLKLLAIIVLIIFLGLIIKKLFSRINDCKIILNKIEIETDQFKKQDYHRDYVMKMIAIIFSSIVSVFIIVGVYLIHVLWV